MHRIATYDVVNEWKFVSHPLIAQIAFGLLCFIGLVVCRMMVNMYSPTAGPFALIYPAVLIATLYGRWQAGLVSGCASMLFVLLMVVPNTGFFQFSDPSDGPRALVNGVALVVTLGLAELFRSNGAIAMSQCHTAIERRELLMHELDHRTKNNLAIVVSLLRLQKNREGSTEAKDALEIAAKRIHSFALANENLYDGKEIVSQVNMRDYLTKLVNSIFDAAFLGDLVKLHLAVEEMWLPREQAVAAGLIANEAITNAAKHAYGPKGSGNLEVAFHSLAEGWQLTVSDDGVGLPKNDVTSSGLGNNMMAAFAAQARGTYTIERLEKGTRVSIVSDHGGMAGQS